jgi:hypothetical protein
MSQKIKVFRPKNVLRQTFYSHAGDTFRELLDMWEDAGYIQTKYTENPWIWIDAVGKILLYDRPTLDWYLPQLKYDFGLFANCKPPSDVNPNKTSNWIFWGRHPKILHDVATNQPYLNFEQREIETVFIGKIENNVQRQYRESAAVNYKTVIDKFILVEQNESYPFSQREYLDQIRNARFGLCLRGFGPKCNREIELMALGTVPILTPEVSRDYFEPLVEGTHFVRVSDASEVQPLIQSITPEKWSFMSQACREWYERNCSPKGSFETTLRIINQFKNQIFTSMSVQKLLPDQVSDQTSDQLSDRISDQVSDQTLDQVSDQTSDRTSDQVSDQTLDQVSDQTSDQTRSTGFKIQKQFACDSLSTMATNTSGKELHLLLKSLEICSWKKPVYILCDSEVRNHISQFHFSFPTHLHCELDQYSGETRQDMERVMNPSNNMNRWTEFMLRKCDVIDIALSNHSNTLFCDSDMVFLQNPAEMVAWQNSDYDDFDVALSPHFIRAENEARFGKYNGGFVFVQDPLFTSFWRTAAKTSSFFEQKCLEDSGPEGGFHVAEFDLQYNYGWWRLLECDSSLITNRKTAFTVSNGTLFYDKKQLYSIHTHFGHNQYPLTHQFNEFILPKLFLSNRQLHQFIMTEFYGVKIEDRSDVSETARSDVSETAKTQRSDATSPRITAEQPKNAENEQSAPEFQLNLIVQYYNDPNPSRAAELEYCLRANLSNRWIEKVYNLIEAGVQVPEAIRRHPKYVEVPVNSWLTYKKAFSFANKNLAGKYCCLLNLDIFLDHTCNWAEAHELLEKQIVLALSRFEFDGARGAKRDENLAKLAFANSQDAWVFKAPLFVAQCDFRIGELGCDNAIAHRLKNADYTPLNWSGKFRIFHYDKCRGKNGTNFLQKHAEDSALRDKPPNNYPEEKGYYLLPDFDAIPSIDALIEKLPPLEKYKVKCQIMTQYNKIRNR